MPNFNEGAGVLEQSTDKFVIEGQDVKIPKAEDVQKLLEGSTSLSDLTARLESKYPGYTLPDAAFVEKLLGNKQKNLDKIKEHSGFSGGNMSFLYTNEEGKVARSEKYDESGSEIKMGSTEESMTKLQDSDTIFLVKKGGDLSTNN